MTKFLAIALALAMALFGVACGEESGDSSVSSEAATYEVEFPDGWEEASDSEKETAASSVGGVVADATGGEGIEGVAVTSLWAQGDLADPASPSVIVIREPIPDGVDFAEFVEISNTNIEALFADALTGDIVETEPIDIAGEPAPAFDYEATLEGTDFAKRVVFIERGGEAFALTLSSAPGDAETAAADLDEIAASWEWAD